MSESPPTARELAVRLTACGGHSAPQAAALSAAGSSLERLRAQLEPLVGDVGFRALVSRALALAKREAEWLDAVTVAPDGSLQGLDEAARAIAPADHAEGATVVVTQLLRLLVTFVGEDLTARLVSQACTDAPGQDAGARVEENVK